MKNLALLIIAAALFVLIAPLAFILQTSRFAILHKDVGQFFFNVAIGIDQVGGSIIYNEQDWTVSSCTGFHAARGNKYAQRFEQVINFLFGKNHCYNAFLWESDKNKEKIGREIKTGKIGG